MKTCSDMECRYFIEKYESKDNEYDFYEFCTKHNKFIPEEIPCENYLKAKICFNCKHKKIIVYESGCIDCIDYHCKLQENKFIFSDINFSINDFISFPDCPINKWELEEE